ncbi:hypothetical protein SK128_008416 [Halocaridina rubra]|uniref:Longitudinals lacking protein n=1 Tax=Halocaridina rubra TaxID=373956 RepID=A0AAN8X599_HALRR
MGDGMLSLSWNNHKSTFCHILANLRDKERYTDVTLACEGKFYQVHKLVLSTCSEFFEAMFENTPCKHPVVVLNHIKHDEIESLLSYMYAGVVNVAQSDLARLIKAAELLKIKGLAVPDEPPQEADVKRTQPSSWNSDRSSPAPKRRKRDDSGTPVGGSQTSNSPASSPRASPYTESGDYIDKSRTLGEGHASERRGERREYRSDSIGSRGEDNKKERQVSALESPARNSSLMDETLVKEEILDDMVDNNSDIVDSGLDYGVVSGDPLDTNESSNPMLPNKYEPQVLPSQSQEPVVEALAGPSGMQGWLGDMGGGFSSVESFRGEGSQQDLRQTLPTQQQQQMALGVRFEAGSKLRYIGSGYQLSRRFQCPYCKGFFRSSAELKCHIRIHTGEKPFKCPYCKYCSAQKGNIKIHVLNMHKDVCS